MGQRSRWQHGNGTEYCEIARQRIEQDAPLLNRVEVAVEAGPVN